MIAFKSQEVSRKQILKASKDSKEQAKPSHIRILSGMFRVAQ
jgi:hypothetical protein